MKCAFCDIAKNKRQAFKVWENKNFLLILDSKPIQKGHLLLIPKKHFKEVFLMPDLWFNKLFKISKKATSILRRISGAKKIGLAVEGFGVSHAHVHLVPVNKGNDLNPLQAKKVSHKALQRTETIYKKSFQNL